MIISLRKVIAHGRDVSCASADLTVNGGTIEGGTSIAMYEPATVTLNGGTFCASEYDGAFYFAPAANGSKVIIPAGYAYSGGTGHSVSGTITGISDPVKFVGSIVKAPMAEVIVNGVMTKYDDAETLMTAVNNTKEGEMSIKLFADCDLGNGGKNYITLSTTTTLDLNGHTLTAWININEPTTINDSSYGKTGKIVTDPTYIVLNPSADLTINGGTFEGKCSMEVYGCTVTLNGGTYSANAQGAFVFNSEDAKVVIADGCRYTDGGDNSLTGTFTGESAPVMFAGSVVDNKYTCVEVTHDGMTTKYNNVDVFVYELGVMQGEVSIKLLADCDFGDNGEYEFDIITPTTLDLNGHTLTAWIYANEPTVIDDSSEAHTGKIKTNPDYFVIGTSADLTVNGGTLDGGLSINMCDPVTVTLNGGTYCANNQGAFLFNSEGAILVIADGYEYTDGKGNKVSGTLTSESAKVMFAGSVVKEGTATAVDNINAQNTQKTIKTIDNGQIVIIRGGERFNLRGAKIK